jgi:plasmid stabilization system protein ParE
MRLVLHPKVYSDIDSIMAYYEEVATTELANEFYAELRHFMTEAATRPESFAVRERDIHRVNLHRFPYHFLCRIVGDAFRILVIRHHSRHPSLGAGRR